MKTHSLGHFYGRLQNKKEHFPWHGQLELTYRCNLNCVHCYCKGLEDREQKTENRKLKTEHRELSTQQWKTILDEIHKEGCLWLTLTGGDPLIRDDFLEIYSYAKNKGFIITIFTNGQSFREEIIKYLVKSPPFSIEITLNGISKNTYEEISQVAGSFERVMTTIRLLKEKNLLLILKSNCLKQNKAELVKIKAFTEELLGKPQDNKYYFKYDTMIYPRLTGDRTSCNHRLTFEEMQQLRSEDTDIWEEYQRGLHSDFPDLTRGKDFLYRCNSWTSQFFINPFGRLKFCQFTEKFSVDLKTTSFKRGFYQIFPQVLNEKFKTNSQCQDCPLRPICYHCPARAYLEIGDEETPVPYYCELAKANAEQMKAKLLNC